MRCAFGWVNPRSACPSRAVVSPQRDERGVGGRAAIAAVAGQNVVEPHPVVAPARAQTTGGPRLRRSLAAGTRRATPDRPRHVQRSRGLHVEHVRVLGRVGDLQDRRRSRARNVRSRSLPRSRRPFARTPNSVAPISTASVGTQARRRAGQHSVHAARGYNAAASARPAVRPQNRQPPRKVPSSAR